MGVGYSVMRHFVAGSQATISRVSPSGQNGSNDLSARIGEHSYYWPFQGKWGPVNQQVGVGSQINVDTIVSTLIVMAIIIVLALLVRARLSVERPRGLQNALEYSFEFVNGFVADSLGNDRVPAIGPLAAALFLFILLANYIGLLTIPNLHSPTSDVNTTVGFALMVAVLIQVLAWRAHHGLGGYVGRFFQPFAFLAPINLLEEITRPLTLALRLFGNIFAGEVLILVFAVLLEGVLPALPLPHLFALALGTFVGAVQAFLFAVLTVAYIGIATSEEGH